MTWACANGHPVREGMFTCSRCGSGDVRERDEGLVLSADADDPARARRASATNALRGAIAGGALLYLLGVIIALTSIAGPYEFDGTGFLAGTVISVVGSGVALVGIVGYGVKLGNEATDRVPSGAG